jgi:hypothetical protein
MADEKEKLTKEEKAIVELTRQQKENMAESADLASKMVGTFKKLNVEMEKNQNASKLSNSFNKQILSDTKARATIESQMASDIGKSQQKIIYLKMAGLRAQTRLEQEIINLKKKQNDDVTAAQAEGRWDLIEDINKKAIRDIQLRESAMVGIKNRSDTNVKAAEEELKANQELLKNIRSQAGYMAHLEDSNYAALGPFGEMASKAKQFSENIKVIPLRFMLFNTLIKAGVDRFIALDKAAEDFRKQTGFSNTQMVELRKNAESINVEFQDMGVGINEVYTSAKALTDVFGRTSLVSREAMQNVSLMSVNLGVAAEDSANVLATFQGLGKVTQEAAMNVMKVGASFSEKAGIPFSLVMKDIANASEQTTALLGANPSKLMKSAIAARALGTDLNKIVSSQRKLLDFSSSINEELEASALLGRSISFQKARQLAYDGDIEGAAKATLDSVKAAGDFNAMNVYQREALAKASGMELKDLTKMMAVEAQRSEIELRGTDEQKAKLKMQTEALEKLKQENDLSKEGLLAEGDRAIRQQKMQGIMTKLKNTMESIVVSLGDILEPIITALATTVVPIFKFIASIAKILSPIFKGLLLPIEFLAGLLGKVADEITKIMDESEGLSKALTSDLAKAIFGTLGTAGILGYLFFGKGGFSSLVTAIGKPFKAVVSMAKNIFTNATKKGLVGDFIGPKLPSSVDEVGKISKTTKDVKSGTGIKDFLSNLATGLTKMGTGKVFAGAFNLGATGVAFLAMTAGILGFIAVAVGGKAVGAGLIGLSLGLSALGNPKVGLGVLILMGVSAAFVGFAYAGKLAANAFTSIAKVIPNAIGPFIKFALISPLLYAAAGAISALSISLALFAGASVGGKLLSFFTGDPFEKFQKLADLSERLKMSAEAMKDISMAAASFVSINAFADSISKLADSLGKLNDQLGAIKSDELSKLSQLAASTNTPEKNAPSTNTTINTSGIEGKLDTLTNLLTGGAVRVYLDGKNVSSVMAAGNGR